MKSIGAYIYFLDKTTTVVIKAKAADILSALHLLNQAKQQALASVVKETIEIQQAVQEALIKDKVKLAGIQKRFDVSVILQNLSSPTIKVASVRAKEVKIALFYGDITRSHAQAIVNAANSELAHMGGIAKVIADKAGPEMLNQCQEYIKKHKQLPVGSAMTTTAGALGQDKIIVHTVGPIYNDGLHNEKQELRASILSALRQAGNARKDSIALPAISSGIFKYPVQECCETITLAVEEYLEQATSLKTIYLFSIDKQVLKTWLNVLKCRFQRLKVEEVAIDELPTITNSTQVQQNGTTTSGTRIVEIETAAETYFWKDNNDEWKQFKSSENKLIISNRDKGLLRFNMVVDGQNYTVDLSSKTQTNLTTGYARRITNDLSKETQFDWFWYDDRSVPQPYSLDQSSRIEQAYLASQPTVVLEKVKRYIDDIPTDYRIDFKTCEQKNLKTGFARSIVRKQTEVRRSYVEEQIEEQNQDEENEDAESSQNRFVIIKGPKEAVVKAKAEISALIASYNTKKEVVVLLPTQKVHSYAEKRSVKVTALGNNKFVLEGVYTAVIKVFNELQEKNVEVLMAQASSKSQIYPVEWPTEFKEGEEELDKVVLPPSHQEYLWVVSEMRKTLPNATIVCIERIQNKYLWNDYYNSLLKLKTKNGFENIGDAEKWLFHGTRNTDPIKIYKGELGFDMRFSAQGMWGIGTYFAVNASYSCPGYAYSSNQGKQVFYARVAVGKDTFLSPNGSLKMPPQKPVSSSKFAEERYDSVSGETGGSKVYIVYEPHRAYPAYLITFN